MASSTPRFARLWVSRDEAERLEAEYAAIVGELGKVLMKADVYGAIAAVGRAHRKEVLEKLRAAQ